MKALRTSVVMAGLSALVTVACDGLLGIHVLDGSAADASGDGTSGASADATANGEASEASTDASAPSDARTDALDGSHPITYGTSACAACAHTNCGTESDTCAGDPAVCGPYESCLGNCNGDPACRSQCTIDHMVMVQATDTAAVSALSACLASKCENECGLTCGAFAGYFSEPGAAAACQSCLNTAGNACADSRACGSSVECDAYWRCYMACATPDCKFGCALKHDAGAALFQSLQKDYSGSCATPCAFGQYWACVGHLDWPAPKSQTVAFTVPVIDFIAHSPVPGASVSICGSCPCGTAVDPTLAQGTTDDAGTVTLQVPQILTSATTGLYGCVQVTSPDAGTVPYFGYWGYPLSEPVVDPVLGPGSSVADIARQSAQTLTADEIAGATGYIGVTQLPTRGLIGAAVFDCLDNPAPGVRVTINSNDPLVSMFYGSGDAGSTTRAGLAFFYNVPPGPYQVTATPGSLDGGASSTETVNVASDTTTAVGMFPTPPGGMFPMP